MKRTPNQTRNRTPVDVGTCLTDRTADQIIIKSRIDLVSPRTVVKKDAHFAICRHFAVIVWSIRPPNIDDNFIVFCTVFIYFNKLLSVLINWNNTTKEKQEN